MKSFPRTVKLAAALFLVISFGSVSAQTNASGDATVQAQAIFNEYWQWVLREYPEWATQLGDHRYDDRLSDQSAAAVDRRRAARVAFRDRVAKVDATKLSSTDRVSLRILRYQIDQAVAVDKVCAPFSCGFFDFWSPVTQLYGPQFDLPYLTQSTRFASVRDYEAYLNRLDGWPVKVGQLIERMEKGMKLGWMPAKVAITPVPRQLDAQLDPDPTKSPEYKPFQSFPADIAPADRERLAAAGQRMVREKIIPAFRRLRAFYEDKYLPAASEKIAASSLPPGLPYYETMLALMTTTGMSPKEIHELGLAEVARINTQMDEVVATTGFKGTRAEFQNAINTDAKFLYTKPEDLLAGYRDIAKRADAALPRLFAELPRLPYGVRAMLAEEGDNADHYTDGAADGSRAGYFDANVNRLSMRPKWAMETTLLHEAVPGHHLQIARAQEMRNLPDFRRNSFFVAYAEGWALYAESLGYEMGFYADPYSRFGNLSSEMLRAARLVVDTGLHALGWTREQAMTYLEKNAALTREEAIAEVDRYIVLPGQATAYKIGELKIKALRSKAKAALGEKFDLRRFHNVVIDSGAVPLDVLEVQIDEWIAGERSGLQ